MVTDVSQLTVRMSRLRAECAILTIFRFRDADEETWARLKQTVLEVRPEKLGIELAHK